MQINDNHVSCGRFEESFVGAVCKESLVETRHVFC